MFGIYFCSSEESKIFFRHLLPQMALASFQVCVCVYWLRGQRGENAIFFPFPLQWGTITLSLKVILAARECALLMEQTPQRTLWGAHLSFNPPVFQLHGQKCDG